LAPALNQGFVDLIERDQACGHGPPLDPCTKIIVS
jgi:hypothetical protein